MSRVGNCSPFFSFDKYLVIVSLQFEWDEQKADRNAIKHGVSFEEAKTVFADLNSMTIDDLEHSIEEDRYIDIGTSDRGRLLVVVTPNTVIPSASLVLAVPLDLSENLYCSIGMAFSQYLIDDVLRMFQQR